jgi:hypothetical protein
MVASPHDAPITDRMNIGTSDSAATSPESRPMRTEFFGRRFEEAVPRLWGAIETMPLFPNTYRYLAACYAHMRLFDEARATIARLRAITPQGMVNWPLRRECFSYARVRRR